MRIGRALIGLLVGGLIITGIAGIAYAAGLQAGQTSALVAAGGTVVVAPGVYGGLYPFLGFGGFIMPLIAGLLFIGAIFAVIRAATRPRWGGHTAHGRAGWGPGGPGRRAEADGRQAVPPMVAEMHRRLHEQAQEQEQEHSAAVSGAAVPGATGVPSSDASTG